MATFAESFFYVFLAVQMVAVILLTPAFVAGAIAEEKEKQTLDFLLATDLRNREIVLGKLASRLGNLALLVLAGLPILSLMEMLGGVEPRLVLGAFAVTGITLLTLAALSVLCSVHARRARDAILLTYVLVVIYQGLTLGFLSMVHLGEMQRVVVVPEGVLPWLTTVPQDDPAAHPVEEPYTLIDLAERLNDGNLPMFCYRLGQDVARGSTVAEELPRLLRDYAIVNLSLAALCVGWAVLAVRRVALRARHGAAVPLRGKPLVRRPRVGRYPLLWKEAISESGFRVSLARRAITYLTVIAVAVPTGAILFDYVVFGEIGARQLTTGWALTLVIAVPMLSLLAVAVRASAAVSGERDRQTLDSLLMLPVSSDAVLFSKWLGCLLGLRWTVLAVSMALTVCAWIGGPSLIMAAMLLVVWSIYAGLIAMIGIAYSIACQTTLRATLATLLTTAMLTVGHWALWLVYLPFLLAIDEPAEAMETLAYLHRGLTPPAVLAEISRSAGGMDGVIMDDGRLFAFSILGLGLWLAGTVAVWFVASRQFQMLANRAAQQPPGLPPPDEALGVSLAKALARRRRRRRRIVIAFALLLPVAVVGGAYVYVGYESDRRLRAVTAELDADDPGWRLADLKACAGAAHRAELRRRYARSANSCRWWPRTAWARLGAGIGVKEACIVRLSTMSPPEQSLSEDEAIDLKSAPAVPDRVEASHARRHARRPVSHHLGARLDMDAS